MFLLKSLIQFFINTNIWVGFCVVALTVSSEILLESTNLKISSFVFFATIFAYNFQRIVRLKKGHNHACKNWLENNIKEICLLIFFATIASVYIFITLERCTQIAILFMAIICLFYPFGIRRIPFAKIFIISFVWTVSTMLLLILENNIAISQNIIWQLVSRFLFVFAITIPFDIRDFKYDSKNLITIPIFFGVIRSKIFAFFALFICVLISLFQHLGMHLNLPNLLALILLYILASIFIKKSDERNRKTYFSFWVESLSVFSYFLLVIAESIF